MPSTLNVNGSRGEITPLMHARVDTEFYQQGYAQARNTVITRYGPHTRVPGTIGLGPTKDHTKKFKLLPFEFSETQLYAIEFGNGFIRFWTPEGQIVVGPTPYEIASPYVEADLPYLHGRQSADVIYLFCQGKRPKILKRIAETNWTLTDYVPKDGPYLDLNQTSTTLTLGNRTNIMPIMTSNSAPAPVTVAAGNGDVLAYAVFRGNKNETVNISASDNGYLLFDLGPGNQAVLDNYYLIAPSKNATNDAMFSQWDLQGSNDGITYITIDSRDNERGWAGSETRYFETNNKTPFAVYRLLFSGGGGSGGGMTQLGGWYMHRAASDQSPTTLTASSIVGINDGTGFKTTDVGRPIRLQGTDGKWRWAEITSYVSPTVVNVRVHGQSFITIETTQNWALGAWSGTTGWPRTGRFYEDRLALAGWPGDPVGLALSVSAAYDDFRTSSPNLDDDAIKIRMTGGRLDVTNWLADSGSLVAGTGGGLRTIGGRDDSSVLKNDNLRQKLETSTSASRVQPVGVESVQLFMDRIMRRLYELGYSYEANGFIAREVSVLNDHLFETGIERIDYLDAPYKFLVALRSDGKVVFFAYDREQKIAGGTLVDFGGFVEDIMVLPGRTYPELWLGVRRTRDGNTRRTIEKMAPFYNGRVAPNTPPVYAACSAIYDGALTATVPNLTMLAATVVGVWADGRDLGDVTVSGAGLLTLPNGVQAQKIVVGERMHWRLQSLPLPPIQGQNGLDQTVRVAKISVDAFESALIYGGGLDMAERLRTEDEVEFDPDAPEPIRTVEFTMPVDDSWKNGGVYVIEGDSMFPATIRGVSLTVEVEP